MKLRERGLKTCVLLRWGRKNAEPETEGAPLSAVPSSQLPAPSSEPGSVQKPASSGAAPGKYLPGDLREAFARGRWLGSTYGDLVDAWEVDNEPDLGFVPEGAENYAAFLKAMYLGLKAGSKEGTTNDGGQTTVDGHQQSDVSQQRVPLVFMGALGLPPGPWLERFAANDGFAYTDGFNYHYYGYAEDFTGVYRSHENAVKELGVKGYELGSSDTKNQERLTPNLRQKKPLPIFLTEIGYGMLGKQARDTKDGRLRQWRWFRTVGEQIAQLRIEGPMAFLLTPYLEYDTLEFGLTVPAKAAPVLGVKSYDLEGKAAGAWTAGGIAFSPTDFGVKSAEPWMKLIGRQVEGNEITPALAQWMTAPKGAARSWPVTTPAPSPIVIDFIAGEGLSPIKRYNGSFVTGRTANEMPGAKAETGKPKNKEPLTKNPPVRAEEFMIHVRTGKGNLYEVYPTRMARPEWQRFLEARDNFTMSFYGRAELPWRFKDNRPGSLVVVMYPKQLPAVYEFRRPQLIRLGEPLYTERTASAGRACRYGQGTVVLYNFSGKEVNGRLKLPSEVEWVDPSTPIHSSADSASSGLKLRPGERREIPVGVKVPWESFERIEAPITFVPEDPSIPPARFLTAFMPDIGGMKATVVASLTNHLTTDYTERRDGKKAGRVVPSAPSNRDLALSRLRATEEAPMTEQDGWFAQPGARVARTSDGFAVTVTETPPGKEERVEVEIPWPDDLRFAADGFLSLEYRLAPTESSAGKP